MRLTSISLLFKILNFAAIGNYAIGNINPSTPTAIFVDSFTEYLSGHCKKYCDENGIRVVECVSPYMQKVLSSQGYDIPDTLKTPDEGDETNWAVTLDLLNDNIDEEVDSEHKLMNVVCLSESDAGVSTAERIQQALHLRGNGKSPHLRNKFLLNERAAEKGLQVVKQKLVHSLQELESFLINSLGWKPVVKPTADDHLVDSSVDSEPNACVLKPCIGVASEGVHKCKNLDEVRSAFESLIMKPKYGGGLNEALVVQECLHGTEYAVDTVSKDGEIKVVALWKYKKYHINDAPFVYQCSELVCPRGSLEKQVCDYCVEVLTATGVKWGPTHTEVMLTKDGPRLIEVNARFHAQHFKPITDRCLGYDALISTIDAFFYPEKFEIVPSRPNRMQSEGVIIHLISVKEGKIENINHIELIKKLESVIYIHMEYNIGDSLIKTVDIRTDCGYILLSHPDRRVLEEDYATIVKLQPTLFDVVPADSDREEPSKSGRRKRADGSASSRSQQQSVVHLDSFFDQVARDFIVLKAHDNTRASGRDSEYSRSLSEKTRSRESPSLEPQQSQQQPPREEIEDEMQAFDDEDDLRDNEIASAKLSVNQQHDMFVDPDSAEDEEDDAEFSNLGRGLSHELDEMAAGAATGFIVPTAETESSASSTNVIEPAVQQQIPETQSAIDKPPSPAAFNIYKSVDSSSSSSEQSKVLEHSAAVESENSLKRYAAMIKQKAAESSHSLSRHMSRLVKGEWTPAVTLKTVKAYCSKQALDLENALSVVSSSPSCRRLLDIWDRTANKAATKLLDKLGSVRLKSPAMRLLTGTFTLVTVNYLVFLVTAVFILPSFENYIL